MCGTDEGWQQGSVKCYARVAELGASCKSWSRIQPMVTDEVASKPAKWLQEKVTMCSTGQVDVTLCYILQVDVTVFSNGQVDVRIS